MIRSLQIYRGIAALLVVLFHLRLIMEKYFVSGFYSDIWIFGSYGVQFFFVLSGFIIFHAHGHQLGQKTALSNYCFKRINRIYPPYWVITLTLAPFWFFVQSFGEPYHKSISAFIMSIFLLPQSHYPHLGVGWTLVHEVFFYALFATLFINRRFLYAGFVWGFGILAYCFFGLTSHYVIDFIFSPHNLLFLAGICVCIGHQRLTNRESYAFAAIGLGIFLFVGGGILVFYGTFSDGFVGIFYFGMASVSLVFGSNIPHIENKYFSNKFLLFLGSASYSIYLVHYPILSGTSKLLLALKLDEILANVVVWIMLFSIAVIVGCVFHVFVEMPLARYGTSLYRRLENSRQDIAGSNRRMKLGYKG